MRKLSKKEKLAFVALVLILIGVILGSPFLIVGATKNDWKYDFVGWFLIVTAILSAAGTIIYYTYVKELPETKKVGKIFY